MGEDVAGGEHIGDLQLKGLVPQLWFPTAKPPFRAIPRSLIGITKSYTAVGSRPFSHMARSTRRSERHTCGKAAFIRGNQPAASACSLISRSAGISWVERQVLSMHYVGFGSISGIIHLMARFLSRRGR